jgi:ADP-L-glycero-D-manno-heptose 6-epimerase
MLPRITGLKYFNIFGPNEDHKGDMRSVVHKAFGQITQTGRLSLFKSYRPEFPDGGQRRDFLYVKDAVAATVHLAEHIDGGGLYNIGSGIANTWLSLGHAIFDALNLPPHIDFIEMPDALSGKYQYFTCADIGKLRASGFTQRMTPLEDAVRDYVRIYLQRGQRLGDESTMR